MGDVDTDREAPFSFGVTVAFTLNYIIGTGFLTLPWGFNQTGKILGIGVLGLMTMFATSAALFMLEAMARAEAYANQTNNFGSFRGDAVYKTLLPITLRNDSQGFLSLKESRTENSAMLPESTSEPTSEPTTVELLAVGTQKYEVTELCKIFMGKQSVRIYTVLISLYMYGTLWAYSTVFADSLAMRLPLFTEQGDAITPGSASYMIYLLVFASIVVPSSMIELSEQVFVQVTLSFCRVLMLVLMVSTIASAMLQQQADIAAGHGNSSMPFGPLTRILSDPSSNNITHDPMNAKKLYLLLPMAAYATIFHHSIPSISQPVRNKSQLGRIFTVTLLLCFIAYTIMSIVISNYFGEKTLISSNLDWEFYWGKLNANREIPLYARCISSFVVLLPALDVASAFPLNAITLGNSLMSSYYGSRIHVLGVTEASRAKIAFRAIAAMPPILAASMISNLGTITHFAGVSGFAIAFIFPSLLAIYSERLLVNHGLPHKTQYSCWLTSRWICLLSIAIGLFLIVFVVTSLCVIGPPPS